MATTTITDVRTIGVNVSDQDDALRFYVDMLGFEKQFDAPITDTMRWITVAAPGAATSIALLGADTENAGTDTGIRFVVPDAAAEHASMHDRGIRVCELLLWDGVPPMFTFDDPVGNHFYVVEESW